MARRLFVYLTRISDTLSVPNSHLRYQNKTSSAAQLKHLPTGMVIKSQATRSRSQNRKIARRLLAEKLEVIEKGPESRVAMKGEIKKKKKASKSKKAKRKYRALGEDGDAELEGETSGHVVDGTQSKEKILEEIHQTVEKVERSRAPSDSEGQDHQGR